MGSKPQHLQMRFREASAGPHQAHRQAGWLVGRVSWKLVAVPLGWEPKESELADASDPGKAGKPGGAAELQKCRCAKELTVWSGLTAAGCPLP